MHNMALKLPYLQYYCIQTAMVFLPDGETSRLLFPEMISLISGSTVQPESTYYYLLKIVSQF